MAAKGYLLVVELMFVWTGKRWRERRERNARWARVYLFVQGEAGTQCKHAVAIHEWLGPCRLCLPVPACACSQGEACVSERGHGATPRWAVDKHLFQGNPHAFQVVQRPSRLLIALFEPPVSSNAVRACMHCIVAPCCAVLCCAGHIVPWVERHALTTPARHATPASRSTCAAKRKKCLDNPPGRLPPCHATVAPPPPPLARVPYRRAQPVQRPPARLGHSARDTPIAIRSAEGWLIYASSLAALVLALFLLGAVPAEPLCLWFGMSPEFFLSRPQCCYL